MQKKYLYKSVGQSITEYAVLMAVVAAALIAMQVYIKRGIQGKIRDLADQISSRAYEPGRTISNYTTNQSGVLVQQYDRGVARTYQDPNADIDGDGVADATTSTPETVTRSGYEEVIPEIR